MTNIWPAKPYMAAEAPPRLSLPTEQHWTQLDMTHISFPSWDTLRVSSKLRVYEHAGHVLHTWSKGMKTTCPAEQNIPLHTCFNHTLLLEQFWPTWCVSKLIADYCVCYQGRYNEHSHANWDWGKAVFLALIMHYKT